MTLIKITTDREPWAAGLPHPLGAEIDVPADEAEALIANGFAEALDVAPAGGDPVIPTPRRRRAAADDEPAQ
jgi:hypothetical protein